MKTRLIDRIFKPLSLCTLLIPVAGVAQTPFAEITDWKNNAKGAYSIIHDDYGDPGVDGIWQYADTICSNRGIKFTFGAIAQSCENSRNVNGYADPYEYAKSVMIAQHGHEIISHSHTHSCAVGNAGWNPCDAPFGTAWGENPNSTEFNTQLVTAHTSIKNGTGFEPVYYIFPYDRFTKAANDKLKDLGYIGSRTGWTSVLASDPDFYRNGYENSDVSSFYPDNDGFFRTAVQVFDDVDANRNVSNQVSVLNGEVDNAINSNLWANRELHNVGNNGWGTVSIAAYRSHINYLQEKSQSGDLWVATVSEILTYQIQKLKYAPQVSYDAQSEIIDVAWSSTNSQIAIIVSEYLGALELKCPVTVCIDLNGLIGEWSVLQNNQAVSGTWQDGDKIYANVFPHEGPLKLTKSGELPNQTPEVINPISNYPNLPQNFTPLEINLYDVFEDFETADIELLFNIEHGDNLTASYSNGILTIGSKPNFTGSESVSITVEDEGGLSVTETFSITVENMFLGHTPFDGPIAIPGRIEAENFDIGEEGTTYNEEPTNWEPEPWENPYRSNHPVDIANVNGVGYIVNFTETGEWLEYTIDVKESGFFDVIFRVAQEKDNWGTPVGEIKLLVDGQEWVPPTQMTYTNGWEDYQDVQYSDGGYLEAGGHLLRIEFTSGSVDIDYIDITEMVTSMEAEQFNDDFDIYPNPASSSLFVIGEFTMARVYNQFGQEVAASNSQRINIEGLPAGVYYVRKDGGLESKKFLKVE